MVRHQLGALALLAAFALPLTASAQTVPAPGAAAPAPPAHTQYRHPHHRNGYMRAMQSLHLSDAQKQQIAGFVKSSRAALRRQVEGVLTDDQRAQLRARLARPQTPAR